METTCSPRNTFEIVHVNDTISSSRRRFYHIVNIILGLSVMLRWKKNSKNMISPILVAQFWKQLKVVRSLVVIKLITKVLCLFLYDVQLHSSETDLVLIVYQNCKFKFEIDDHSFPCFQAEDWGVQFFWKFKLFCEMFQQHKTFVFLLSSFNSCKEVTKE